MAISTSPRKVVPLNSSNDFDARPKTQFLGSTPSTTRRAFFCGVVVEGPNDSRDLSEDVQELVSSLGDRISSEFSSTECDDGPIPGPSRYPDQTGAQTRKRAMTDSTTLSDLTEELVQTERSYVKRLRILKESYADPLRSYARSKDTAIIPAYEAKILFGNIDALLPVNEAFLHDLELMITPDGARTVGGVGDIALRHFRDLKSFECYKQYYIKREEAQAIFKREMAKKSSTGFAAFVERIKYTTSDAKNRVGLRELLMDPVQRIPRYTLMFRAMIKHMPSTDPQRARLIEADEIASKIALAETDDQTKRAAIMYCLSASIEGFPPNLISNNRRFIDCIDVEDTLNDPTSAIAGSSSSSLSSAGSGIPNLHCTLLLFDDKVMIVKRPAEKSGRALAGLDDLEKFTNGGGFPRGAMKKSGMSCKGVVEATDVVATDVSGPDMHIYFETPPQDFSDRWSGRPFRVFSVVHPPAPVNQDPLRTESDKKRFLENLWNVQARYRTKAGQSVVLCAEDREVESRGGKVTLARTYFNIYQRTSFLQEPRKTKIVVHIDALGSADPIPFGMNGAPFVVLRVQPMAGDLCRYTVSSNDPDEEAEEDIVQTARVPGRIVHTIHQFGLFKFRTGNLSRPTTPTSTRSRAHIFGLDVISRNLFASRAGSSRGDFFGSGSMSSHRRSKSSMSRSSTRTETTMITASDSMLKSCSSHRTGSTAATSAYTTSLVDEESFLSRSLSRSKKLVKGGKSKSPGRGGYGSGSESEGGASSRRARSKSVESHGELEYSDGEGDSGIHVDLSEMDLTRRLELARRNSKNQHGEQIPTSVLERPVEETIYEEEPPISLRSSSRAASRRGRDTSSLRSTTPPRAGSTTPTRASRSESPRKGRPASQCSRERRPMGPRSASPLPPAMSELPSMDIEMALENTLVKMGHTPGWQPEERGRDPRPIGLRLDCSAGGSGEAPASPSPSPLPRSKRQPFEPRGNTDETPRGVHAYNHVTGILNGGGGTTSPTKVLNGGGGTTSPTKVQDYVEPLSIKKKISATAKSPAAAVAARKTHTRNSPMVRTSPKASRGASTQPHDSEGQLEVQVNGARHSVGASEENSEMPNKLVRLADTTMENLESSHRTIKRVKLEVNSLASKMAREAEAGNSSDDNFRIRAPRPLAHTPQRSSAALASAATKEALQRMEEMRALIGKRGTGTDGIASPRSRPKSIISVGPESISPAEAPTRDIQEWTKVVGDATNAVEDDIKRAISNHESLQTNLKLFAAEVKQNFATLEKTRTELRGAKRQCDLVKNLLADATAENEIMYESFNEELDGMFNDTNLPEDEAWAAMTEDLRQTKLAKNDLTKENSQLKRQLLEAEMKVDEWGALLRAHGLIP